MFRTPKLIVTAGMVILIIAGLGVYAYLQSRDFLQGPKITIETPSNGAVSTTSLIAVIGKAENAAFLTLNGRQIFTDERGRFRESLLLQEGYTIMTLEGKDRFGHTATQQLTLVYMPE